MLLFNDISNFTNTDYTTDPILITNTIRLFAVHYAVIRHENPSWSKYKVFAQAWLDTAHFVLDLNGLVPAVGEIADIANGIIYTIEGNGALVNMDFFPITISQMPKKPSCITYTQKEFFEYFRLNINDFFDDLQFTPVNNSTYGLNDSPLWNSTNPLGAILSININPDEGSVVCSNYNQVTGEWFFSTIEVPWDGTHPVSGHRSFGYYTDVVCNCAELNLINSRFFLWTS